MKIKKIYDISRKVNDKTTVWPGDPSTSFKKISSVDDGDDVTLHRAKIGMHAGTHVDAPHHFMNDGRTVEAMPLEILTGPCFVALLPDSIEIIDVEVLRKMSLPEGASRILFGTRNSRQWKSLSSPFTNEFVAISAGGARWLVERGVKLVGVDYLSVAPFEESRPTHEILLEAGVVVVEGLDLSAVPRGFYELYCLPLKLLGADGAPARAILLQT